MTFSLSSRSCLLKLPIDIYELNQVKSPSGHHYFTRENLVYHKVIKVSEKNYEAGVSTVCPSSERLNLLNHLFEYLPAELRIPMFMLSHVIQGSSACCGLRVSRSTCILTTRLARAETRDNSQTIIWAASCEKGADDMTRDFE